MANVFLKRSAVSNAYWHAFIPADDKGEYYCQVDFGPPEHSLSDNGPYTTILGMTYGKLFDCKDVPCISADGTKNTTDLTFSGDWRVTSTDYGRGSYSFVRNFDTGEYFTYDPPADHDQIHLFVVYNSEYAAAKADLEVSWSDDSTTDLIQTDYGDDFRVDEIIVLSGAKVGTRVLKIGSATGKKIQIVGIRSWNSEATGDLDVDPEDSLISRAKTHATSGWLHFQESVSPHSLVMTDNVSTGRALEWAIAWDSGGVDYDFSGGNNHMVAAAGNNIFTMAAGYLDNGPEIWVDDALSGRMWSDTGTDDTSGTVANVMTDSTAAWVVDSLIGMTIYNTTNVEEGIITDNDATTVTVASGITWDSGDAYIIGWPKGQMLSGDKIVLRSDGTLVGATAGTAPDCEWLFIIDKTGITVTSAINWNSDIVISGDALCPMMPFSVEYKALMALRFPLSSTLITPTQAATTDYANKGSVCEIVSSNPKFLTRMISTSPVDSWTYVDALNEDKLYCNVSGSTAGWNTPAAGDVLVLSGKYEVRRTASNGSEEWQGVSNSGIYRGRYNGGGR